MWGSSAMEIVHIDIVLGCTTELYLKVGLMEHCKWYENRNVPSTTEECNNLYFKKKKNRTLIIISSSDVPKN